MEYFFRDRVSVLKMILWWQHTTHQSLKWTQRCLSEAAGRVGFSGMSADVADRHRWRFAGVVQPCCLLLCSSWNASLTAGDKYVINFCFQTGSKLYGWIRLQQGPELFPCRFLVFLCESWPQKSPRPRQRVQTDLESIDAVFWRHHLSCVFSRRLLDSGSRFTGMPSCPGGLGDGGCTHESLIMAAMEAGGLGE